MNVSFLSEVVPAITDVLREGEASPYFFVIGAGASFPSVPLAEQIVQELRDRSKAKGGAARPDQPPDGAEVLTRYEYWFKRAYPDPRSRQLYLRRKIQNQPIPPASFRLATLLADGRLSKLVVTTNFDLFISRALALLERETLLYDSAQTANDRFMAHSPDLQVLHVHGTYQYYDCANLRGEINDQSRQMVGLVESILRDWSPLVIGYGGWEGDVFMTALRRRLYDGNGHPDSSRARTLPYVVRWFCYRESVLNDLPGWLKNHPSVVFVLPEPPCGGANGKLDDGLIQSREIAALSQPADATLSADFVFQRMIDALGIPETDLDKDPILFFVRRLKMFIRGLEDSQVDTVAATLKSLMAAQEKIQEIQKLLYGNDPAGALRKCLELYKSPLDLGIPRRRELMEAASSAISAILADDPDSAGLAEGIDLVVSLANELRSRAAAGDDTIERLARALVYRGMLELWNARYAAAVAAFDEVIDGYADSPVVGIQDARSSALVNKGVALSRWRLPSDAKPGDPAVREILDLYQSVIDSHRDSTHAALRESVAGALVNKAFLLNHVGSDTESQQAYDDVIALFGDAVEPSVREHVVRALINKAFRLGESHTLDDMHAAIALYDRAVSMLKGTERKPLRVKLTLAWNGLAFQKLLLAKRAWSGDRAGARAILLEARQAIREAFELAPKSGMVLGNLAYIEFLLGENPDLARARIDDAVRYGGEVTRQGEIEDTRLFTIPEDQVFLSWILAAPRAQESANASLSPR